MDKLQQFFDEKKNMSIEILELAFKMRAIENGIFDNDKTFEIIEEGDRLTLYAKDEVYIDKDIEIRYDGWERIAITGFNRVIQVNLGFEYFVQATYVRKGTMAEIEERKDDNKRLLAGHREFLESLKNL